MRTIRATGQLVQPSPRRIAQDVIGRRPALRIIATRQRVQPVRSGAAPTVRRFAGAPGEGRKSAPQKNGSRSGIAQHRFLSPEYFS